MLMQRLNAIESERATKSELRVVAEKEWDDEILALKEQIEMKRKNEILSVQTKRCLYT